MTRSCGTALWLSQCWASEKQGPAKQRQHPTGDDVSLAHATGNDVGQAHDGALQPGPLPHSLPWAWPLWFDAL